MEIRTVLGGGEVHLDVVQGLALAEIVVVGGGEEARAVAPHDRLQVAAVDVERQGLEPVHLPPIGIRGRNRSSPGEIGDGGGVA